MVMARLRIGDGRRGTDMGPLVTKTYRDKVAPYMDAGVVEGAELVVDGREVIPDGDADGFWLGPTLVGCKLRIPTPRNTKIALTGSGCQEVSKRASSVIRWERAGNGFDVTRRGIAGIAPNSKRPDSPGRFAQAAIEYSRRTPPSRSIRRILTEPSSGPEGTRGTRTSRSIPRCGLAEL